MYSIIDYLKLEIITENQNIQNKEQEGEICISHIVTTI